MNKFIKIILMNIISIIFYGIILLLGFLGYFNNVFPESKSGPAISILPLLILVFLAFLIYNFYLLFRNKEESFSKIFLWFLYNNILVYFLLFLFLSEFLRDLFSIAFLKGFGIVSLVYFSFLLIFTTISFFIHRENKK